MATPVPPNNNPPLSGANSGSAHQPVVPARYSSVAGAGNPFLYDASLPPGTIGSPYTQTLSGLGGTPPYSFALAGGALPPGLVLSSAGAITGTPTTAGSYTAIVRVTDAGAQSTPQSLTLTIGASSGSLLNVGFVS